jgi:hypothetical protein
MIPDSVAGSSRNTQPLERLFRVRVIRLLVEEELLAP